MTMSDQKPQYLGTLPDHGRFAYSAITQRKNYRWPNGSGLAVYLALNIEHFAFGQGMGAAIGPLSPQPDVLNYSWPGCVSAIKHALCGAHQHRPL